MFSGQPLFTGTETCSGGAAQHKVEYGIFKVDPEAKTVKLSLRGAEILKELDEKEKNSLHRLEGCTWHPEYGSWMVEATPRGPFSGYAADLVRVERNMRLRRKRILSVLRPGEVAPTMTCFPLMGVGDFVASSAVPPSASDSSERPSSRWHVRGPVANSAYIPDVVINPHPRFGALTKNIRARRGNNVDIRIPLFRDENTPEFHGGEAALPPPPGAAPPAACPINPTQGLEKAHGPHVHMDAMAFGMGCCCLQVTFQARDVDESRYMYDQLAVLSPVMLALTAATPILKGRLVDTDVRWDTIATSVDDRTPAERGLLDADPAAKEAARDPSMVGDGVARLYKSRYDSISSYLHYCKRREENPMHVLETYNDIPCEVDKGAESFLVENGVDRALAFHVAHLFARDPLVIFDGAVEEVDDTTATEHFENIQSTNWQTVRWKPPPPRENEDSPRIGWRTEFRSMEMQTTDAENAAFTVFVVLVTRVILAFDLNLYIPLSKFWWRMHMAPPDNAKAAAANHSGAGEENGHGKGDDSGTGAPMSHPCEESHGGDGGTSSAVDQEHKACDVHAQGHEEMTIEEIMLGKGDYYPGLVPLVYAYLGHIGCDAATMDTVDQYMILICKRASGELKTSASWIRDFVHEHPAYKQDSVVSEEIAHDLVMELRAIGEGEKHAPSLLGGLHISPIRPKQAYDVPLSSTKVSGSCLAFLVKKYTMRDRWTERDRQLNATLTEKTTQTPPSTPESMPRGDSTTSSSSAASQVGPLISLSGSGDPTAGAAAAGVKGGGGGGGGKLDSPGLRATRETSMSYY
ncbi:Glutamate cysteine ligase [Ectocarpus siliculosus]|uniref:Glutamate--cysteine ligase n=1 Tax=Ectocarpus siliculosus TaxID=2880 RepID=D8LJD4_ECTSI|nr:Glutamate cysteine ligase [Ectocarpus siliculosus]|eukprot:CBN79467.1 Glutamate cysteine ligase [Ectocarpus siliculosus]